MPSFCPHCDAANRRDAAFCAECGRELTADPGAARGPEAGQDDRVERSLANRELGRAMRALLLLKRFYIVLAIANGLVAVWLVWTATALSDEEAIGFLWVLSATYGALTAFLITGALLLHRNPFLWGVVLAALQTLNMIAGLLIAGGVPVFDIVLTTACWAAVSMLTSVRKLVARFPELRAARRIRGERYRRTGPRGEVGTRLAERRAAERRRKLRVAGAMAVALVLVVGTIIAFQSMGSPAAAEGRPAFSQPDAPLDPVLERFESAWAAGDVGAVAELYPPRLAERKARLQRRFDSHDLAELPELGEAELVETGDSKVEVRYRTRAGAVTVVFQYEDDAWVMVALRLP